jgi:hypothetical protein
MSWWLTLIKIVIRYPRVDAHSIGGEKLSHFLGLSKLWKLNPLSMGKCAVVFVPPLVIGKLRNEGVLLTLLRHDQCQ